MSLLKGLRDLERAYQTKDWERVRSSYEEIAGEPLDITGHDEIAEVGLQVENGEKLLEGLRPPKKSGRPKKQKLEQISQVESSVSTVKKQSNGAEVKWSGNSFVDTKTECLEDLAIDKKLKKGKGGKGWQKAPPREPHRFITVSCDGPNCGKSYEVDPSVVSDSKKLCPRCLNRKATK